MQQGGNSASISIPLGTIVKAGAGASKITKGAKAVDAAADTTKATDAVSDANKASTVGDIPKTPEPKGPNGNGGENQSHTQNEATHT